MASFVHFLKSLFIPLFLALTLYLLLVHLLLPFLRRNRQLYTSYLPVSAAPGSTSSSSTFRSALANLLLPASVRERFFSPPSAHDIDADDLFDDEEGEGMIGFDDPVSVRRREALEQRRSVLLDGVALGFGAGEESERRLSRELEEGFRDESESESEDGDERESGRGRWFP